MRSTTFICILIFSVLFFSGSSYLEASDPDISKLKLPPGFKLTLFQGNITNARSMTASEHGTIFVGTRTEGKVYALKDTNKDGKADEMLTIASGLNMPNGVAYKDRNLYVAEVHRIIIFKDIEKNLKKGPTYEVFFAGLKKDKHHGWKYLAFGPDGNLYIPVGAPCNVCLSEDPIYASIQSLNLKTKVLTPVALGVRNTVGFTWHPKTKEMWFTDNGRDLMGDDTPPCELNHLITSGAHFGFPYQHAKQIKDPEFFAKKPKALAIQEPAWELGAHVAPLGLKFMEGPAFPPEWHGLFLAEHGSWNRSKKSGYKVNFYKMEKNKVVSTKEFMTGFMENEKVWGRPVDLLPLPDGSLLISDDYAGAIYRVSFEKPVK